MSYWLIKSEPSSYSWEKFVKEGRTTWDGIRNYAARNHLRSMKKGDEIFFYHSNVGLDIVGIAHVIKESYQDPSTKDPAWLVVDLKPVKPLQKPVTLQQVKNDPRLKDMALLKISRLSVQPVTEKEWTTILELSGEK